MISHQNSCKMALVWWQEWALLWWWRTLWWSCLGVFLPKLWLSSQHHPKKQWLSFFGALESQQAKRLGHSPKKLLPGPWLSTGSLLFWLDYFHFLQAFVLTVLGLQDHVGKAVLVSVPILWRNASGFWSQLLNISIESSVLVCSQSGHSSFRTYGVESLLHYFSLWCWLLFLLSSSTQTRFISSDTDVQGLLL